ncbi:dTDP-glucose 4,6-dehydratase [Candidatus Pelagibacter sp.]|uniref:dTDP-glucose 4,6-dehydratase n=1 Tax=Candidatus Pelagibacter sp. TaxID=2024849 RepID=UPI003F873DB1
MKKIFVTGGLGFIGSNLIKHLINKNYYVINIDKISYSSNFYNTKDFHKSKKYKFFKCNIGEKKFKKLLFAFKPICVFNLAAETHVDRSIDNPKNFIQSNIVSVYKLLEYFREFSKKNKSKLIHISTDEVYGDINKGRTTEDYPYKPSSPYAASKASSDHLVYSYIRTFNVPAIITNCSNNYGPKQHPEKLIPKLIYNIINNRPLPIYGKGNNSREWIYVDDHCEALIKIFLRGRIGEFYNIGSNKNLSNLQVVNRILAASKKYSQLGNKVKINFVKDRPGHDIRYALNSNKLKKNLKWRPKVSFNTGIKLTIEWYLKNKTYFNRFKKEDINKRLGNK